MKSKHRTKLGKLDVILKNHIVGRLKWHALSTPPQIPTGRGGMGMVTVEEGKIINKIRALLEAKTLESHGLRSLSNLILFTQAQQKANRFQS